MIRREELVKIGQFNKPHGIKGELSFTFTNDSFDESECPFLICELDGIFVPFCMEAYRFKSNTTALVKLKGIDSENQARTLANLEVYFPKQYIRETVSDESFTWDYFIGYSLIDKKTGCVGEIVDVDETTLNVLFVVEKGEEELLIPAAEEMIEKMDEEKKELYVDLPEGLLDI